MPLPITREINRYANGYNTPHIIESPSLLHLCKLWASTVGLCAIGFFVLAVFTIFILAALAIIIEISWSFLLLFVLSIVTGIFITIEVMIAVDIALLKYLNPFCRYRFHFLKIIRGYCFVQVIPLLPIIIGSFGFIFWIKVLEPVSTIKIALFYIFLTASTGMVMIVICLVLALSLYLLSNDLDPDDLQIEFLPWFLLNLAIFTVVVISSRSFSTQTSYYAYLIALL